ncbi:hypothetical protein EIP91_010698 [Steccherinum ochraceum]|uniref:Uncharacterized protein n=1 Tax=Steccherinum ochraceum TaxID=92696 RepID=A0A4R0RCD1_9APHY|nr:hypothetical protein EIP91_010698 [Steccherinum ochraceum]
MASQSSVDANDITMTTAGPSTGDTADPAPSDFPTPPLADITARRLLKAKGSELQYWIELTNEAAREASSDGKKRKRVLLKSGKVNELRQRLADYFGFDLVAAASSSGSSAAIQQGGAHAADGSEELQLISPAAASGRKADSIDAINRDIRMRQWIYLLIRSPLPGHYNTLARHPIPAVRNAQQAGLIAAPNTTGLAGSASANPVVPSQAALEEAATQGSLRTLSMLATVFPHAFPLPPQLDLPALFKGEGTAYLPASSFPSSSGVSHQQPQRAVSLPSPRFNTDNAHISSPGPSFGSSLPLSPISNSNRMAIQSLPYDQPGSSFRSFSGPAASPSMANTGFSYHHTPMTLPARHASRDVSGPTTTYGGVVSAAPVASRAPELQTTSLPSAMSPDQGTLNAFASCHVDIVSLQAATGPLRDVIRQMKNGEVQACRARYGPPESGSERKKATAEWIGLNVTITRRERIYQELVCKTGFNGDEERFFKFFTQPDPDASSRKRKRPEASEQLRPLRLVSQAIPHMRADVRREMARSMYLDPDTQSFSESRWQERWQDKNWWEVWRALGKEWYTPEEQKARDQS